jgi:Tfp pilus assembly protein PilZ
MKKKSGTETTSDYGRLGAAIALAAAAVLGTSCSTALITSPWKVQNVTINGRADDWQGALTVFETKGLSLGIRNDDQFMYLCLTSDTPEMRTKIITRGLTVWLDPAGGKSKAVGIRFPISRSDAQQVMARMNEAERQALMTKLQQAAPQAQSRLMEQMVPRAAVLLGPEKDAENPVTLENLVKQGVEVRSASTGGVFVYELKIPLAVDARHPFAIGVLPGQPVGVGIDIPSMPRVMGGGEAMGGGGGMGGGEAMGGGGTGGGEAMGGGGGTGGGEATGGGMGGGGMTGGGMRGGGTGGGLSGLKFWIKVNLAKTGNS